LSGGMLTGSKITLQGNWRCSISLISKRSIP
jgi:hypothetical protein